MPLYVSIVFQLTTLMTVWLFYKASRSGTAVFILLGWIFLQAAISYSGIYLDTFAMPPRFLLLVAPPLVVIILLFMLPAGRRFLDRLDTGYLTLLHMVRIPVELVLFWLFVHRMVPQIMTFEGRNFDILSGITAVFIWYLGYIKRVLPVPVLLVWNFICLALLLNIVVHGVLSAPTPFQQFAFEQPNLALVRFPFVWLPCCIVPLVLLSHLTIIRQMLNQLKVKSQHPKVWREVKSQ